MPTPRTVTQTTVASIPPEPPPAIRVLRQSVDADLPQVLQLQTPFTKVMFGDVDLTRCIEKCVCKTLVNASDEVVAFLIIMDHPNVPVLSYCHWVSWIRRLYRIDFASPWNTRFINYLVWDSRYPSFFSSCLKSIYKNDVKLGHIVMVTPPGVDMFPELEPLFTLVYPSVCQGVTRSSASHYQNLHMNLRHRVLSKLTVRRAGEEDNIDVQPLVYHQLEVLKFVYGDIKLDSVIDLKTCSKSVLVAEKGSVTVGVMTLSSRVNYHHVNFFFYHVLETSKAGESILERLIRTDTVRLDFQRGLPFTQESMDTDEQLSMELNIDKMSEDISSVDEDEDRDDMVVFWDEDGDMFRVVDPVKEYLIYSRHKSSPESGVGFDDKTRKDSEISKRSEDYTYWERPSWSTSFLHREETCSIREKKMTTCLRDQITNTTYVPVENAFKITLLALHPDLDVRYAFDILEASFESFADKHFCLLSLPTAYQGSPVTQHMVRMTPKLSLDFPHELYVAHRNAMFSELNVRLLSFADYAGVLELVDNFPQGRRIFKDIKKISIQESPETKGFILECEGCIVGVAVITIRFELHQLHPHFKIDELINMRLYNQESHGLIRHLVVCPVFLKSSPFFLRQIMHQNGLETLSYCLFLENTVNSLHNDVSSINVLGDMTPVTPHRRVQYDVSALDDFLPLDHVLHADSEFALFIATEKLLSIPKIELNYRIVVVGGSVTAMSFLENLIFRSAKKQIHYNNLVLVSMHGFPMELKPHVAGDKMVPHNGIYTREYFSRICLSTYVNVLYGALTAINRKEKTICINSDHWIRYDYLFLMTGMQYCKPWPTTDLGEFKHESTTHTVSFGSDPDSEFPADQDLPKQDCHKNEDLRDLYNKLSKQYGDNLFVINTPTDAIIALGHLKGILKHKKEGKILVYGHGLNTYTCVESLLVFGVPGHKIVLVISPHLSLNHDCLEVNPFVDKIVIETMEDIGVTVYRGFSLIRWSLRYRYLEKIIFRDKDNIPLVLDCIALFCYGSKITSAKTYLAASNAGIVYNNGIIIDHRFRTNDEYIYAAGPGTRYSNRYNPTQYAHHKYYNSFEIGLMMSKIFRRVVEPDSKDFKSHWRKSQFLGENAHPSSSENQNPFPTPDTLPKLSKPVTWVAQLPGGWNYVKVSVPGRPLPLECKFSGQGDSGPILITGVPVLPDGPGYFQLSFTVYNTVREIVLLSQNKIPYNNLYRLYGKHERLLNNLYEHYNQGFISDMYAFFSQPWAYALYTARFDDLTDKCKEMFVDGGRVDGLPPLHGLEAEELVRLMASQDVSSHYFSSTVPMYVDHLLLRYISERQLQLPMYFTDTKQAFLSLTRYRSSPLHRDPAKLYQRALTSSVRESQSSKKPSETPEQQP